MRVWFFAALLTVGCQSAPQVDLAVNPSPSRVEASQVEPQQEKTLNRPPADRAKDLAPPVQRYQPEPTAQEPIRLRESEVAVTAPQPVPPPVSSPDSAVSMPTVKNGSDLRVHHLPLPSNAAPPLPGVNSEPPQFGPRTLTRPSRPTPGRPDVAKFSNPQPPGYPGMARTPRAPGAIAPVPPHLPGQGQSRERELEQAYLQSRADALNTKYHQGRPVLNANSPEVLSSAQAPPPVSVQPTIPGMNPVIDAFQQSETRRQEWQMYRNQQRPMPGLPGPR